MRASFATALIGPFILACCAQSAIADTRAEADQPNIILLMTDDQGYGDLGIHGNPVLQTPHMDRLAQGGAAMTTFFVGPVCAPTRAGLMTGRYHYRTRVVDTFKGRAMMEPDEDTLAELLRHAGYSTGIFGKWHLGDSYPMRPNDQGFDESLVHRGGGLAQPSDPIDNRDRYTNPVLIHNGHEIQTRGYCTDLYFQAADRFITRAVHQNRPFFAYIATNAPHGPFHDVPAELYEKYRAMDLAPVLLGQAESHDQVARIYAMIENIDRNIGRLLATLHELDIERDTLVVMMFDNGPNTRRFVGRMRGMKSELFEGGIRSPFYIRWPARLKPGTHNDRIAGYIDVMPTLLAAAGVQPPDDLDGRSLLPLLEARQPVEWSDRALFLQVHRGNAPIRYHHFAVREQRWKLVRPSGFGRSEPPENVSFQLFDMTHDPFERHDLAATHPDIVQRLKTAYDHWFDDVSATRPDNYAPPRIILGSDHETRTVLTRQDWRVTHEEGWGRFGRWHLEFHGAFDYRIEFAWPEPVAPGTLEFTVGNQTTTVEVKEPTDAVVIERLAIAPGTVELSAILEQPEDTKDPYHVILTRLNRVAAPGIPPEPTASE
ncbi:MAG: arylsulfatase [Verrucomicrobiota bacterium]|nr:arylsulfatase [Verrucomicrobiota bacterium]